MRLAQARYLKRKHDLRRKWCMLTKRDLSHMGRNQRKTSLMATQPPLVCKITRREKKEAGTGAAGRGNGGPGQKPVRALRDPGEQQAVMATARRETDMEGNVFTTAAVGGRPSGGGGTPRLRAPRSAAPGPGAG